MTLQRKANSGAVTAVARDRVKPNGLAFSPDERILYVADAGGLHVPGLPRTMHAYNVSADGASVSNSRLFATLSGLRLRRLSLRYC